MNGADVERNYIKFFPVSDMAFGQCVRDAEAKFDEIINCEFSDIVGAVEGYNIVRLFDEVVDRAVIRNGGESKKEVYKAWAKRLRAKVGKFAGGIQEQDFFKMYTSVPPVLEDDFWIFSHIYKIWKNFSGNFLADFEKYPDPVFGLFEDRNFVKKFGNPLSEYLRVHFSLAVELFICNALSAGSKKYYLPKELSSEDKESIISHYVDSNSPSINSLQRISDDLLGDGALPPRLRFRAKKRLETLIRTLPREIKRYESNLIECISKERLGCATFLEKSKGGKWNLCFSRKWIRENLDYPTLLNNLIFIFEFVDSNCRSRLIQPSVQTLFDLVAQKSNKEYYIGEVQQEFWKFHERQIEEYYNVLRENGVYLEDVFQWFFQEYLKKEFGIEGFSFNVSVKGVGYEQRCRMICPEIEKVLKLWKMYCEDGYIDLALFEFFNEPLVISDIPSLCARKHIYAKGTECKIILRLLFSTQTKLCIGNVAKINGKNISPFFEVLSSKILNVKDFEKWQEPEITFLVDSGILEKDESGNLSPNRDKIIILKEINDTGVYCSLYHPKFDGVVREMCSSGWLEERATLFSREEEKLLNFILNNSLFKNSLGLRNKYLHGTNSCEEIFNKRDYMILLNVIILIVLKINEDLRLREPEEKRFSGVLDFVSDTGKY